MDYIAVIARWLHIIAGIIWIGHLYFFNFVNIPFAAKMKEAGVGKTTVPELMPRALWWFRWGAAWTWITGVILLLIVFYAGEIVFDDPFEGSHSDPMAIASLVLTFGGVFIYDLLFKSPIASNAKVANTVGFALAAGVVLLMEYGAGYSYRSYNIHIGAMFGTAMAFNVWFRIWPAQQKIIAATKAGEAPDPAWLAMAGGRSRHNTYLSVPLIWTMMNQHTVIFSSFGFITLLAAILLGWHIVWQFYQRSTKIEGF